MPILGIVVPWFGDVRRSLDRHYASQERFRSGGLRTLVVLQPPKADRMMVADLALGTDVSDELPHRVTEQRANAARIDAGRDRALLADVVGRDLASLLDQLKRNESRLCEPFCAGGFEVRQDLGLEVLDRPVAGGRRLTSARRARLFGIRLATVLAASRLHGRSSTLILVKDCWGGSRNPQNSFF
ncbi:hypothetical protein BOSEA31B_20285 [Hyphomicrobiales bacterium]|nr:hypothetical protein BOSEA31B_20285 [Hyphomicrobiales bacterium]CAH1702340.1 hypothetical protein BOSEA1005_30212 [Hyphomicrobiales bacterium]CAI0346541.1 hypothetical protein BO1005MUT1_520053 [Hyphomicrobiales bacterium]